MASHRRNDAFGTQDAPAQACKAHGRTNAQAPIPGGCSRESTLHVLAQAHRKHPHMSDAATGALHHRTDTACMGHYRDRACGASISPSLGAADNARGDPKCLCVTAFAKCASTTTQACTRFPANPCSSTVVSRHLGVHSFFSVPLPLCLNVSHSLATCLSASLMHEVLRKGGHGLFFAVNLHPQQATDGAPALSDAQDSLKEHRTMNCLLTQGNT